MDILNPYFVIIAIIVICLGQLGEWVYLRTKRKRDACHQREVYHKKLEHDSLVIECKKLKEELQSVESVRDLLKEANELEEELKDGNNELGDLLFEDKLKHLSNELTQLQDKSKELEIINKEICQERAKLSEGRINGTNDLNDNKDSEPSLQDLTNNINLIQADNHELESQLACHKPVLAPNCHIDPEVSNFMEKHQNELTLEFLEKAYDKLLELKASNPSRSFDDHIKGIKSKQDYMTELAELRLANKQAEIKLNLMKQRYENELSTFNESRLEHLFKICGNRQLADGLKEKNQFQAELKINLEREFETKNSERIIVQDKFHEAEEQCNVYWQAWKETEVKRQEVEAEKREERRLSDQSMNLGGSRSSLSGGSRIPPPPPIMVPNVDEVRRLTASQSIGQVYANFSMNHVPTTIPSPPPVEVPLNEIFGNRSLNAARSNRSTSSTSGGENNRSRGVGSSYGKVFNSRSGAFAQ